MMPTIWDHLLTAYMVAVFPLYAWKTFPQEAETIRRGGETARIAAYRRTVLSWIVHALLLAALWMAFDRPWGDLGLRPSSPGQLAAGFVLGTVMIVALRAGFESGTLQSLGRAGIEKNFSDLAEFFPRSAAEERWFRIVSVNAGITEELIFRGYLLWYLTHFMSTVWAAAVTVVVFALAHSYQGAKQLPGIALMATWLIALYLLSGSLLLPILFHAAADAVQGRSIAKAMNA